MSSHIPRALAVARVVVFGFAAANPVAGEDLPAKLKAEYEAVEKELRAGNWEAAEKGAAAQFKDLMEKYAAQGGVDRDLVLYTMIRAVAEKGLGRDADASWHWHMAASLLPALNGADLSPYGVPAKALQTEGVRARASAKGVKYTRDGPVGDLGGASAPKLDKDPSPRLPVRMKNVGGFYLVEVVVEADGRPSRPLVLGRRGPVALELLALDKMREWVFKPAMKDGSAVVVPYLLGVGVGRPVGEVLVEAEEE